MVLNLSSFIIPLFFISLIAINNTVQVRAFASAETEIDSNSETLNYKMQRPSFPEHWGPPRKCIMLVVDYKTYVLYVPIHTLLPNRSYEANKRFCSTSRGLWAWI